MIFRCLLKRKETTSLWTMSSSCASITLRRAETLQTPPQVVRARGMIPIGSTQLLKLAQRCLVQREMKGRSKREVSKLQGLYTRKRSTSSLMKTLKAKGRQKELSTDLSVNTPRAFTSRLRNCKSKRMRLSYRLRRQASRSQREHIERKGRQRMTKRSKSKQNRLRIVSSTEVQLLQDINEYSPTHMILLMDNLRQI